MDSLEDKYLSDGIEIPDDDILGINQSGEAAGEDPITTCWTQNEVEMVLENDLPRHSGRSPRSPRHSGHRRSSSPRLSSNAQPPTKQKVNKVSGRKNVPSLIFAMVEGQEEPVERSPRETKNNTDAEEESVNEVAVRRLSSAGIESKLPRSKRHATKHREAGPSRLLHGNDREMPSTLVSNHKDSLTTSVRDRKHPQIDPAEIESRILAAAYDHESACSSTSAPSLSVYSSASSDFSLYLGRDRRRNEASQRATRHTKKQLSSNAYKNMRSKKRQQEITQKNISRSRGLVVDPDAAYVSEDDDEDEFDETYDDDYDDDEDYEDGEDDERTRTDNDGEDEDESSDEGSYSDDDQYDDEDSVWEEKSDQRHLDAYDVEDDEEDLMETPRPRYLRDCLELLRTPETDDHACSKQESALEYLPQLLQGEAKPADLPDLAVPLALELMRMEDKFGIKNFSERKLVSVISLTSEEPLSVGQRLILLLWEDIAFMDRLDVLTVLSESAFELSGNKELETWHKSSGKE